MRLSIHAALILVGFFASNGDEPKKETANSIKGAWVAVKITASGRELPREFVDSFRCQFKDKTYVNSVGEDSSETGDYSVQDSKDPRTIDFDISDGPDKGKKQLGIYKIVDNSLTIVVTAPGSTKRPASFDRDPDLPTIEYVLKRSDP